MPKSETEKITLSGHFVGGYHGESLFTSIWGVDLPHFGIRYAVAFVAHALVKPNGVPVLQQALQFALCARGLGIDRHLKRRENVHGILLEIHTTTFGDHAQELRDEVVARIKLDITGQDKVCSGGISCYISGYVDVKVSTRSGAVGGPQHWIICAVYIGVVEWPPHRRRNLCVFEE